MNTRLLPRDAQVGKAQSISERGRVCSESCEKRVRVTCEVPTYKLELGSMEAKTWGWGDS